MNKIYAWLRQQMLYIVRMVAYIYSLIPWVNKRSYLYYYKKEPITSDETAVCFIFDSEWNTLETWLPVLYWLKEHKHYRIISFWPISSQDIWVNGRELFHKMMVSVSDVIIANRWTSTYWINKKGVFFVDAVVQEFLWALHEATYQTVCKELLGHYKIAAFLRTLGEDKYWGGLYELFPDSPHITHPHTGFHGMFTFSQNGEAVYYKIRMNYDRGVTIYTSTDSYIFEKFSDEFKRRMIVVGTPRYDEWWLNRLYNLDPEFLEMKKRLLSQKRKIITVCMPRFSHKVDKWHEIISDEFHELKTFFESGICDNVFFVFKFHPAVEISTIDWFFQECFPAGRHNYYVSNLPLIYLAKLSSVVISAGMTTVTMDAVIVRSPTIEFYMQRQFSQGDLGLYLCDNGSWGTFLKLHRLALYASNASELQDRVSKIFSGEISWDDYYSRLEKWVNLDGNACKRMADLVDQYIKD